MVRGIANIKIGFGDLILILRYFFKLKVSTPPNLPSNISAELDALRLLIFNKTSSKLAGVPPNNFFKNFSSTVSVLTDVMIEHFGKTTDPSVLGMMTTSNSNESYPKANLVNYLTDKAPQLTLVTGTP